jgi:hypothetical protein
MSRQTVVLAKRATASGSRPCQWFGSPQDGLSSPKGETRVRQVTENPVFRQNCSYLSG